MITVPDIITGIYVIEFCESLLPFESFTIVITVTVFKSRVPRSEDEQNHPDL